MKKIFCCLLAAVLILGTFAGCKKQTTPPTESIGTKDNAGATQTESTNATQPDPTEATQPDATEMTQPDNKAETKPDNKEEEDDPSAYDISNEIFSAATIKAYSDSYLTFIFPGNWEYSYVQGENTRSYSFAPVVVKNCEFSFAITDPEYAVEPTEDHFREINTQAHKDFVIETFTEETIQGFACIKAVYSYTEDNAKVFGVSYMHLIDDTRRYGFSFRYPAELKDIYEPIFAYIMDSVRLKSVSKTDISTLPLTQAYETATKACADDPKNHRDMDKLQPETKQIVEIDGKYYQSYVASNVDHRYIWISQSEFPDENQATWDWYMVGSAKVYSLELLSKPDRKGTDPYPTLEITDYRVRIKDNKKVFTWYPYLSVTLPVEWKCYIRQGEDGSNYYFQDPVLGEKCRLSASLAEAWTAKDRTEEEYRKLYSSYPSYEDVVIESVTKESVGGLQGTKVVYAYTYEGTRYIGISYDNYLDRLRVFDLQIVYPADQKDTYEPIFAAIIDSAVLYKYPD